MKSLYLDANIIDHIDKGIGFDRRISGQLINVLKGTYQINLSFELLEEIVVLAKDDSSRAKRQIKIISSLTDEIIVFKQVGQLFKEKLENFFEKGTFECDPYIREERALEYVRRLIEKGEIEPDDLSLVVTGNKRIRNDFAEKMAQAIEKNSELISFVRRKLDGAKPTFFSYFSLLANKTLSYFIESLPEMSGKSLPLEKMMGDQFFLMFIGSVLSFMYSLTFEKLSPKSSYAKDLKHAGYGGLVDGFVSNDASLLRIMDRVPHRSVRLLQLKDLVPSE